jgi:hypothetical protein
VFFRIAFEAFRVEGDFTGYQVADGEYLDGSSGRLWTHSTGASGLQAFAGPDPMGSPTQQVGLFVANHREDGLLVTDWALISNVDIRLSGIHESELAGWDGMATTWESAWHSDMYNATWVEQEFTR